MTVAAAPIFKTDLAIENIILMYKKRLANNTINYRLIILLNYNYKIYAKALTLEIAFIISSANKTT